MNFSRTGQYIPSSSSSSSSDDEFQRLMDEYDLEQQVILHQIQNNNLMLAVILMQQNAEPVPRRRAFVRDRELAAANLFNDYFSKNPTYNEEQFRQRYRMSRNLFSRIVDAVKNHDRYFVQRRNAAGKSGLSTLQKITTAFRIIAHGDPVDAADEYIKIRKATTIECIKRFCRAIRDIFAEQYLRAPTTNDVARLFYVGKERGFPGMLGSLDCMQWKWKNCPTIWEGQYAGQSGSLTIMLEVVADYDLWIWHAYFRMPGSNNDINVLEASNLFSNGAINMAPHAQYVIRGSNNDINVLEASNLFSNGAINMAPHAQYVIRGKEYNMGYYLANNKYPKLESLVQSINAPTGSKQTYFATKQEVCRKDAKRAVEVLQSRFAIVANPKHFWSKSDLQDIMTACIIMHNMIVEDERDLNALIENARDMPPLDIEFVGEDTRFQDFVARFIQVEDEDAHFALQNALVDHMWEENSNLEN